MNNKVNTKSRDNLVPFKKDSPNINRRGRTKKVLTDLESKLIQDGHPPVSKAEFYSYLSVIIGLPEDKWNSVKADPMTPFIIKEVMKSVEKDKMYKVIPDILDRVFGKAKEEFILNHSGLQANSLATPIQVIINGPIKE